MPCGRRANAWEAFAPFAAAVLIAHYVDANQTAVDWLAGTFVVARTLHGVFYIVDKSTCALGGLGGWLFRGNRAIRRFSFSLSLSETLSAR